MTSVVRAYVDFVSAYSYIAIYRLDAVAEAHGLAVDWQVVSLPHVLRAAGGASPLTQPLKAAHNRHDWQRRCARAGLAARYPAATPIEAGLARLAFHRLKQAEPLAARAFLRAVSARCFGEGLPIGTEHDLVEALAAGGLGDLAREIPAAADDPQARASLLSAYDDALADGMFGAPFMVHAGETFWGSDQLEAIDRHLARTGARPAGFDALAVLASFPDGFGPVFRRTEAQGVALGLRVSARHANPAGVAHGGLLATLADMAAGAQLAHALGTRPGVPTVSLTLDFLRPVPIGGWLEARARLLGAGGRIAFVEGILTCDGTDAVRFSGTLALPRPASFS